MIVHGDCAPLALTTVPEAINPPGLTTVAVAVKGGNGGLGGKGSRRAVRWAVENIMPEVDRFVLVHVVPLINSIPTPSGKSVPIEELDANVVQMYVQEKKKNSEETFIPFKKLCKRKKVETLVLDGDNPASALLAYATDSGVNCLVLGSCTSIYITRKLKGPSVPSVVLKHAPQTCSVYIVSRHMLITTSSNTLSTSEKISGFFRCNRRERSSVSNMKLKPGDYSSSVNCELIPASKASSVSDLSDLNSVSITQERSPNQSSAVSITQERSPNQSSALQDKSDQSFGSSTLEIHTADRCSSVASTDTKQPDLQDEVEKLRLELLKTVFVYNRACEDLVNVENKVRLLSSECLDEERQVDASSKREEIYRKIAAEEKEKHLEAVKEVEMARNLLAKEAYERQIAELKVLKESLEKQKIVDALFSNDRRYKRYTRDEIEIATDLFSDTKMIGEGTYGKVYRCNLDNTPVAVKVCCPDASDKKEEFLKEVEVLSQLRHPHIVLLIGACPETRCLVYEYVENGSLEDHIFHISSGRPLPWFVRFRIAFEVACGLAFLHNSKPDPVVHRDLKPANIFLDRNYTSKIGDVGLAKFLSNIVPDNITEYSDSILSGTLYYMDPEYQRTGTVRPKSDLYAFGIITLQLLAARHPNGLLLKVENAITNGSFSDILDKSIDDWPVSEAKELAHLALKCTKLRCRDRPDLETEVLPVLKKLADMAASSIRLEKDSIHAPGHYFCPILQEVMDDPQIAVDGFTYEHRAIKAWLQRHKVSPVTNLKLQHTKLIPNQSLRSAIQEWRSRVSSSSI